MVNTIGVVRVFPGLTLIIMTNDFVELVAIVTRNISLSDDNLYLIDYLLKL